MPDIRLSRKTSSTSGKRRDAERVDGLAAPVHRHLTHRLAGNNDAAGRLIGACCRPPRLPARHSSVGIMPRHSRRQRPGRHANQPHGPASGAERAGQARPALPLPALFECRPQPHQGSPGGAFHVRHRLRLHRQRGVNHQPVRHFHHSRAGGHGIGHRIARGGQPGNVTIQGAARTPSTALALLWQFFRFRRCCLRFAFPI
jgi:hypothetical protein